MSKDARKQRVLFVDDEANFLNGIRRLLRSEARDWDMHFAQGAEEALAATEEFSFDVIVSDVSMPGKSGLELLAELQENPGTANIPVIILTGNAESDLKRRALNLGATDLLNKPVGREDLRARLRSVLKLKRYQDEILNYNALLEERVRERTAELENSRLDIVWRLAKAGEFRDEETGYHVMRVGWSSFAIARHLGLGERESEGILLTSPLHDIGKIGIPDGILLKQGSLTPEERETMQRHCEIGAAILLEEPKSDGNPLGSRWGLGAMGTTLDMDNAFLRMAADIALNHHEKWDGSGYPAGKPGESIPLPARIVSMADVYDALRSERSYKGAYDVDRCIEIIQGMKSTNFDPALVTVFMDTVEELEGIRARYAD